MSESFAALLEENLNKTKMSPGDMLIGTVVDIDNDMVIVSTHSKSEGVIPKWQFLNNDGELEVAIGDEVEVALDLFEDGLGATLLSRDKAKKNKAWFELENAYEKQATVVGRITGKVRGGFTVAVGALRAFLPGSLVDVRPVRDTTFLENRDLEFKVIKIDQKRNNVVLSRRAVVEKEYSAEREELLKTLEEGAVVTGVVKNLTDYGAFIDLGGIDGLLHITDMAWRRVRHPSECVEIGQEIKVKVLKYDKDKNRVSLGMKQMGEDPWQNIARRYPAGTRVFGKVNNLTDYGCFVEIEEGVEGLVHVSEMDWTNKNVNPSKLVQLGDEVEVMVLEIDEERRRISLGMKQCKVNPWDEFAATHNKGDKITEKSNRLPTSASSSAWKAASTAWFTCRTSHGPMTEKRPFANSKKAMNWKPSFWRSTPSASVYPSGSSNSNRIRSRTSWLLTRKAASLKVPSRKSTPKARSLLWPITWKVTFVLPKFSATALKTPAPC